MNDGRTPAGTSIADAVLETPDGDPVTLGNRIEVPTIVVLARYYG